MGTRLLLEKIVRDNGKIEKVRVYSHENGKVTVYSDVSIPAIDDLFPAHLNVEVKPYLNIIEDNVPEPNNSLPDEIVTAALNGNLNKKGINETIFKLFPHIQLSSMEYNSNKNTISFYFISKITDIERSLLLDYLEELTPVDCKCEILEKSNN